MSLSLAGFIRYRRLYKRVQAAMSLLQNKYNADVSFFKDKEFLMKILEMEERNVLVNKLVTKLDKIKDKQPKEYQGWMTLATIEVEKYKVPDLWDVFEHDFVKLHPQFKKDLSSKFPDLTDNEYKVCALNEETQLYNKAFERNIVIVTPSTLLATLRTIDSMWTNQKQQENAYEIARQAGALYDKFDGFVTDLVKIGKKMDEAKTEYEGAMNKLVDGKGNLITSVQKLKIMGAKAKKSLPDAIINRANASLENFEEE